MNVPAVVWQPARRTRGWTYGYVGVVRAFTLEHKNHQWLLQPHLPDMAGYPPREEFASREAAEARAGKILADFLTRLGLLSTVP